MGGILKFTQKYLEGFQSVTFFRMLSYGIIFSAVMTLAIGWSQDVFAPKADFPYIVIKQQSFWIAVIFASFSFLFAFAGYVSDQDAREDILSPFRRKLVGYWEVRALTWKIEGGAVTQEHVVTHCTIGIEDVGRKLILHFDITNSDIFKDQSMDITNVMIAFQGEPKKLIYFHDHELQLKQPIGVGPDQIVSAKFPFLGVLNINSINTDVNDMDGVWYDIDNSVFNLARRIPDLNGLDLLNDGIEKGAITFKGALSFKRLPRPTGL